MRSSEIAGGDTLYSPFVAAGWHWREELNLRPGRWLGLLKVMATLGAHFFYTGFFSLHTPFPRPENWVWQAALPSYALAALSVAPDLLFDGSLMPGDMPLPPQQCMVFFKKKKEKKKKKKREGKAWGIASVVLLHFLRSFSLLSLSHFSLSLFLSLFLFFAFSSLSSLFFFLLLLPLFVLLQLLHYYY